MGRPRKKRKHTLPDLAEITRSRMESPMPFLRESEEDVAKRLGMPIVRQLTRTDSAPGGYKALRMSNLGSCARQLAYRMLEVPEDGRKKDGRTVAIFAMGDMVESLLLSSLTDGFDAGLGPEGSWGIMGIRQSTGQSRVELKIRIPGTRVPVVVHGHPDGILVKNGKPAAAIEIKSTSSFGYNRATEAISDGREPWDESDGQWWQANGYLHATGLDYMGVLLLCKDSGAFTSWWMRRDEDFIEKVTRHIGSVVMGSDDDLPGKVLANGTLLQPKEAVYYKRDGKYGKKGDIKPGGGALPWQCCYCSHYRVCWADDVDERVESDYRGRPALKLYSIAASSKKEE